ncbi:MAG: DDE-type integrase/transposase/recombinase [Candidatus Riflebacteria bacterium]|nr:DDE-type integrase/transposase/recombinase [Candidatus Riflebacteria bacterium]
MIHPDHPRPHEAWGIFRLKVVGHLLASPPPSGHLQEALKELAAREWTHPITGEPTRFAFATIEDWYYQAKRTRGSPVSALTRKPRRDRGQRPSLPESLRQAIKELHATHSGWSHQLHYDNLLVIAQDRALGKVPSYATVRRFRNAGGLVKVTTPRNGERAGIQAARSRLEARETRSFEATHVLGLVHSDFHHCSRKLLNEQGEWVKPVLVAILDDRSRLVCHAQWYWRETAENFVHALVQAFLKRGLPRALMTDNGSPMGAAETTQGLQRIGILHETTLPYSPQQNGKQECFWGQVEGRLMAMLEGEDQLTLKQLNDATLAWVEMEYHRKTHSETGQTPLQRFLDGPGVGRPAPPPEALRQAFTIETTRSQRRSDGTISIDGRRYEIPVAYRHLARIAIRYATWDLSLVHLVSRPTGEIIGRIYPRDLEKNADGRRRPMAGNSPVSQKPSPGMAPLLRRLLEQSAATGQPMSYLPKEEKEQ